MNPTPDQEMLADEYFTVYDALRLYRQGEAAMALANCTAHILANEDKSAFTRGYEQGAKEATEAGLSRGDVDRRPPPHLVDEARKYAARYSMPGSPLDLQSLVGFAAGVLAKYAPGGTREPAPKVLRSTIVAALETHLLFSISPHENDGDPCVRIDGVYKAADAIMELLGPYGAKS